MFKFVLFAEKEQIESEKSYKTIKAAKCAATKAFNAANADIVTIVDKDGIAVSFKEFDCWVNDDFGLNKPEQHKDVELDCVVSEKTFVYKVVLKNNSGNFAATAFAESFGGFVSSNVQNYDGENDLAIIDDIPFDAVAALESALECDDNVVSYAEMN